MAKDETVPGLLSKVVKFVRNPVTNWADLDSIEGGQNEAMSKQLLKEMIERKRQNDFVRKREFDMLRKMRKREAMVGGSQDLTGRPSFFQSSLPSKPDDRATTLKKIDEIEAQMSMQWWKTKTGHSTEHGAQIPPPPPAYPRGPMAHGLTKEGPLDSALAAAYGGTLPAEVEFLSGDFSNAPTVPAALTETPKSPKSPDIAPAGVPPASRNDSNASSFSPSKSFAVEVSEVVVHDAELEEAAIRFANGDDAGAEAGLLEILEPGGIRESHLETWMTLFDLYRATGQQDKFEVAALRFIERFDRSAPQWVSMPDAVKMLGVPAVKASSKVAADWVCPSVLGIQTVAALRAAAARLPMPWRLDWKNLKSIDAAAVEPLHRLFSEWANQSVQLRFMADAQLQAVLQGNTISGNREVPQSWWLLRMEALRVTHRPDDFELVALDFCVSYEVSPPAWESARCEYKPLDGHDGSHSAQAIIGDVYRDSTSSSLSVFDGDTQMDAPSSLDANRLMSVELSGKIEGDATGVLDMLELKLMGADRMLISCSKLIRVDFSAAGILLNWVSAREAESREVQFSEVNRLVAAFFNVIGITEHARVVIRTD